MRGVALVLAFLGAPVAAPAPLPAPPSEPTEALAHSGEAVIGAPLPWFAGWSPTGEVINRSKLLQDNASGHVIVLFATWCKPCEAGLRVLAAARPKLDAAGLKLLLVDVGEPAEVVTPFLAARGLGDVPAMLDPFSRAAQTLGAVNSTADGKQETSLPRTVVVDAPGNVQAIFGREGPDYVERVLGAGAR